MKLAALLLTVLALSSCGRIDRFIAGLTGDGVVTCVKGVNYIQFTSGASVMYTPSGSISTCAGN